MMSRLTLEDSSRFVDSSLLAGMKPETRLAIAKILTPGRIAAGTPLLSQGQPNEQLWFVAEGTVAIERRQANGPSDLLTSMSGPAIFGTTTFFRSELPSATIRASTELRLWTLDRAAHETLRRDNPRAAEELALAVLRVLSERFDLLDARISELMLEHGDDHPRATEWADFRARLFEDPAL